MSRLHIICAGIVGLGIVAGILALCGANPLAVFGAVGLLLGEAFS